MSKLLINEPPLEVQPSLARIIGLNEAIVLQQIHYWISKSGVGKEYEGRKWIYNSIPKWQETNFPFWSEGTIKRTLASLKKQKLIIAKNLNRKKYDRTLWYTIDYSRLDELERGDPIIGSNCTDGPDQDDPMDQINMGRPIPENTTETTTETTTEKKIPAFAAPPPPQAETPNGNHQANGSSGGPSLNGSSRPKKEPSEHQALMAAYQDALGYKIPNGAQEGTAAKRILKAGYTIEQAIECYRHMKADDFWTKKHLSLQSVYKQLGAFTTGQNGNGITSEWQSILLAVGQPGKPDISERALRAIGLIPGGWNRFKQQDMRFLDQLRPEFESAYKKVTT